MGLDQGGKEKVEVGRMKRGRKGQKCRKGEGQDGIRKREDEQNGQGREGTGWGGMGKDDFGMNGLGKKGKGACLNRQREKKAAWLSGQSQGFEYRRPGFKSPTRTTEWICPR